MDPGLRKPVAPKLVEQPVARDDLVRVQEQKSENRPLLRPRQTERPAAVTHLQSAEDSEVHSFL